MSPERNLLATPTGRKILFGALYLSEGAPIGYIWWALPTRLRVAGVSVEEITALTSMLVLPWVLKFLWAPLVDTLLSSRWTRRSWIISAQMLMGATLLPLLVLDLQTNFAIVYPLLLLHAFSAATQDVSVDALSIASVPPNERGAVNGWMQAGMLAGRSVLGGGALILGETFGDQGVIAALIAVVWSSTILLFIMTSDRERTSEDAVRRDRFGSFLATLRLALRKHETWLALLFAAVAGTGFEAVGAVAGPFMIDRDFSQEQVGWFFAAPVIIGMIGGALAGGYLSDKIGRKKSVGLFLSFMALNVWLIAGVDSLDGISTRGLLYGLLSSLYVCIGLFTASSYAMFMDLTDARLGATQFSAYMGATNACEAWAGFAVGRLVAGWGYPVALLVMGAISLVGIPLVGLIFRKKERPETR